MKRVGSRSEVMHGVAHHVASGLTKSAFMYHKGRIVSKKKHAQGKKSIKRLFALGYKPTKGKFSLMRKSGKSKKMSRRTRKKGGASGSVSVNHFNTASTEDNPIQAAMNAMKGM